MTATALSGSVSAMEQDEDERSSAALDYGVVTPAAGPLKVCEPDLKFNASHCVHNIDASTQEVKVPRLDIQDGTGAEEWMQRYCAATNTSWIVQKNESVHKHAERLFVDYADWNTVYWDTIDGVLDTYTPTFPCSEHKEEVIAKLLHYYVSMRMRQHCQHVNGALKKQSQEKKELAKPYSW
ncbi:hypothetical protein MRX96_017867 [Rhipicephalus microplus]